MKIKESEKIDKYLDLGRKLRKQWNMTVTVIPIIVGVLEMVLKSLEKMTGRFGTRIDTYDIVEICKNTQKCLKDLRSMKTPVKYHQLMLV